MEKEVKRKTMAYGTAAMLIALMLAAFAYNFGIQPIIEPTFSQLKTFTSYSEMEDFLKNNMDKAKTFSSEPQFMGVRGAAQEANLAEDVRAASAYSTTNVQVAGVDEADIVKTDGNYLYVVSGSNIYIISADPYSESAVIQKITLNETYNLEIYINANKLAVIGNHYAYPIYKDAPLTDSIYPYVYTEEVIVKVYDLTDITNPVITRTVKINGTLAGSRMIGNYVYASIVQPAIRPIVYPESPSGNETQVVIMLPQVTTGDTTKEIQPTEIKYITVTDVSYYFTTILAVNVQNDAQEPTYETFLAGTGSQMYVSENNMYLTIANMNWWLMGSDVNEVKEETLIYRVKLDHEKVTFEAQGSVPGYVLNQFSMDEYNGYFRVATTGWGANSTNNLYVLNMSLGTVGKLEGLAAGERIYSARFTGSRAYLVTFRQIDPFFVIDLGNPTAPEVLGYLKIPGFSGYLHPYDENHVIGVGKQGSNVKLSLFDVTDVTAPIETPGSPYIVDASWSDTSVLYDHKAFLFDKSKQLLALPISITETTWLDNTYYNRVFWQGEYVFNISLNNGFELKGNVTHQGTIVDSWNSNYWVKRALYIGNVLYTVSDKMIKMNSLTDLSPLKEVLLG